MKVCERSWNKKAVSLSKTAPSRRGRRGKKFWRVLVHSLDLWGGGGLRQSVPGVAFLCLGEPRGYVAFQIAEMLDSILQVVGQAGKAGFVPTAFFHPG